MWWRFKYVTSDGDTEFYIYARADTQYTNMEQSYDPVWLAHWLSRAEKVCSTVLICHKNLAFRFVVDK